MPSIVSLPVYSGSIPTMLIGFVYLVCAYRCSDLYAGIRCRVIAKDERAIQAETQVLYKLH